MTYEEMLTQCNAEAVEAAFQAGTAKRSDWLPEPDDYVFEITKVRFGLKSSYTNQDAKLPCVWVVNEIISGGPDEYQGRTFDVDFPMASDSKWGRFLDLFEEGLGYSPANADEALANATELQGKRFHGRSSPWEFTGDDGKTYAGKSIYYNAKVD